MRIFTCKHQLEDMMTCIYDAWVYALRVGHDKVQLRTEPIVQATLFDEYVHVDADAEKTEKVLRSVRNKIGMQAYIDVYYACWKMMYWTISTGFCGSDFRQDQG